MTERRGIVVAALEPVGRGPEGAYSAALAAEARRLATKAGWELRMFSFGPGGGEPVQVAAAVASVLRPGGGPLSAGGESFSAAESAQSESSATPGVVLLADTAQGRELAVLLAERLQCAAVLGCSDLQLGEGPIRLVKPVYGGWLERECRLAPKGWVVATLDLAWLEEALVESGLENETRAEVQTVELVDGGAPASSPTLSVQRLELIPPDPRTVDLTHARRVVAVGAGAASPGLLAAAAELADLLAGSVGATRPVVDEGRLPKERLVGQTGKTVRPELYLALGLSGSPHHVAGIQRAGRILAVNRDPRAPVFTVGDLGFVADLEEVLPALVDKIKAWREGTRAGVEEQGADDRQLSR